MLRPEHRTFESARARFGHEPLEYHAPVSRRARIAPDGHAADLRDARTRIVKTSRRGNRTALVADQHVQRVGIGCVVSVDFFFFGDSLLVHENRDPQRNRFVQACTVARRKHFHTSLRFGNRGTPTPRGALTRIVTWTRIHLTTGILERDGAILLVASRYPGRVEPLWNLPGGRQAGHETHAAALTREFLEETGLLIAVGRLAYVAESFDPLTGMQFTNVAFHVTARGEPAIPADEAHAIACAWVAQPDLAARLPVAVVRDPLIAYLADRTQQYFGYEDAGFSVRLFD